MFFKLEASEFAMSRSYQKKSMSRAHFREFGFTTIRRDIQKQMRGRIKAMEDEEGTPDLPNKIGLGWPLGKNIKFSMREDFSGLGDHKLPFIGRNLKQLHKYGFSKEDIKFIYRYKTK